ncbi:hypothetical protein BJ973_000459 [Actinoplanes tereljensis]|uniref:Uncharacterized protein n=1 Tax=Paractinoplanes tereljensis TaxID=571912 RepID=A0A919NQH2_9ACTN|nr:hypothetical protein [Actinoplanes tereljensis]GIF23185.1 hypothetical protein Ate02nite_59150 [Actinoplanes tereljensis]
MITVDRPAERRTARLQFLVQAVFAAVLLYLATDYFWWLIGPLLLVLLYRSWAVERLSPRLEQYYGHAVVSGAADRMAAEFAGDDWLRDSWARAGVPVSGLLAQPPGRIAARMAKLRTAGPAPRSVSTAVLVLNRVGTVLLGLALGGALAVTGRHLTWPAWAALVLVVVSRVGVAVGNRRQTARVVDVMRSRPREELAALLAPPWGHRRAAMAVELDRLLGPGPLPHRPPEPRIVELLLAGSIVLGVMTGWLL